jgi:hypothetical protein
VGEQTIEYRLSKGLAQSHGTSRDLRANPRPQGPQPCAACGVEIMSGESVMWIAELPHHVPCGRAVVEQREAAAREELRRRRASRPAVLGSDEEASGQPIDR